MKSPSLILIRLSSTLLPVKSRAVFVYEGPYASCVSVPDLLSTVYAECQHLDSPNWYSRSNAETRSLSVGDEIWLFWPDRWERHAVSTFGFKLVDAE